MYAHYELLLMSHKEKVEGKKLIQNIAAQTKTATAAKPEWPYTVWG